MKRIRHILLVGISFCVLLGIPLHATNNNISKLYHRDSNHPKGNRYKIPEEGHDVINKEPVNVW